MLGWGLGGGASPIGGPIFSTPCTGEGMAGGMPPVAPAVTGELPAMAALVVPPTRAIVEVRVAAGGAAGPGLPPVWPAEAPVPPAAAGLRRPDTEGSSALGASRTYSSMVVRKSAGSDCTVGNCTAPLSVPTLLMAEKKVLSRSLSATLSRYMSRPRSASARSISKNLSARLMTPSHTARYVARTSRSTMPQDCSTMSLRCALPSGTHAMRRLSRRCTCGSLSSSSDAEQFFSLDSRPSPPWPAASASGSNFMLLNTPRRSSRYTLYTRIHAE
mmetsp:Transcript_9632/g.23895  ORF Transcript_9632/g.23895 Transcript_9632/m.23895 type:complete len:273 (-) Transcript_9632:556-1374(-)